MPLTSIIPSPQGWVDFEVSLDGGPYYWKGMFYVGKQSEDEMCGFRDFIFSVGNIQNKKEKF